MLLLFFGCLSVAVAGEKSRTLLPAACRQLVLVVTPSYEAIQGTLYKFERNEPAHTWQQVGAPNPIVVGRAGLGWGEGLHDNIPAHRPRKREGDGRSPAGVFRLSTAFGFAAPAELPELHFPYVQITEALECVDDSASQYYNTLALRNPNGTNDWHSSERMFAIKHDYRLGVFVEHNSEPRRAGLGSCIFLHIWGGPNEPTVGCTAMADAEMEALLQWLRREAEPVLVQLPRDEYEALREKWQLPTGH